MNNEEAFSQGARCGHIEGKGRAGSYIIGEEIVLSWEAADNQGVAVLAFGNRDAWTRGYQHGYKLAAEGSPLEEEHALRNDKGEVLR